MLLTFKPYQRTIIYTLLHFVVDGICALIIFSKLYNDNYQTCLTIFLVYNFLAFLTQPFVGILMDRFYYPKLFLGISFIFLSLGILFQFHYVLASICLGIGNSFFHICGGNDVTHQTNNDILSLGIFVSTGAIGLMLGQRYYSQGLLIAFYSMLFLGSSALFLAKDMPSRISKKEEKVSVKKVWLPLCCVTLVVAIRSFVGKAFPFGFEAQEWVFIMLAISTALGKMVGGGIAKLIGLKITIFGSMLLAILCLFLGNTIPGVFCLGIFFFNFSMPITLYYANQFLKGHEGLAFGILAAALIPGFLLGMLEFSHLIIQITVLILCVLSVGIILLVDRKGKEDGII